MSVLFVMHPACERHLTGNGHPERPQRLAAVRRAVDASPLVDALTTVEAPVVDDDLLVTVHAASYVAQVDRLARTGGGWLDPDTVVSAESAAAARRAAGGAQRAAEMLAAGEATRAFVAVRPPGHHALSAQGMGFCLFNNAAMAAAAARRAGRQKVLIIDWDVHHGNGTQEIFWRDPSVLFVSLHQEYWYPGTGALDEIGGGPGEGFTVNIPLPAGAGDGAYADVFGEVVLPLAAAFGPDLIVVSAGYDAHASDPLGGMVVTTAGFGRLAALTDEAARAAGSPLVAVLEGGYDLEALAGSTLATIGALAGRRTGGSAEETPETADEVSASAIAARLRAVRRQALAHWRI